MKENWVVVSVGGSLIVPDGIDTQFLSSFKTLVEKHIATGTRFAIIAGGGKTARHYQDAADMVHLLTRDDLDWLGIHATRLNGHLLRTVLKDHAYPKVIREYDEAGEISSPIVIAAGWRPGRSTDYGAIALAEVLGATRVVNLSNIDYVYDDDPRKNPHAKKFETISWKEFRTLIPEEWNPGLSSPFDPVASEKAEALGLEVAIINGAALNEFDAYLSNKKFIGTTIS